EPRVLRLGPDRLVELGMRPNEPPLQLVRSGVVQTSLGPSELRPRILPESLLSQVLLAPQRPLDFQARPPLLELGLDPPLELRPAHTAHPAQAPPPPPPPPGGSPAPPASRPPASCSAAPGSGVPPRTAGRPRRAPLRWRTAAADLCADTSDRSSPGRAAPSGS